MSPTERDLLRQNILIQLHEAQVGTAPATLRIGAEANGFRVGIEDINRECTHLAGHGLCALERSRLSKGRVLFRLTSAGTDHLEEEGLV